MNGIAFAKMHGLGNDFVVVDGRARPLALPPETIRRIADRHRGVGCDQLITLLPSERADLFMQIANADGSPSGACGNAARCVLRLLAAETRRSELSIETEAGVLPGWVEGEDFAVDMGPPRLGWRDIPLAEERDTLHLGIGAGPLQDPVGVSMGNPHAVFFVDDLDAVPIETLGPRLERHPLFPERANIGVAQVIDRGTLRLRVFERGAGLTLACGSGACAAAVAAIRRGLTGRALTLCLDGGDLRVAWPEGGGVIMTGPAAHVFDGVLDPSLLGEVA
jgi:diaminopimelate epimerase